MGFLLVCVYIYIYILVISKWAKYPGGAPPLILTDPISMADFLLPWTSQDLAGYHDETRSRQGLEVCGQ